MITESTLIFVWYEFPKNPYNVTSLFAFITPGLVGSTSLVLFESSIEPSGLENIIYLILMN